MQSALSFAPLHPVGFVNFHGATAYFSTGRGGAIIPDPTKNAKKRRGGEGHSQVSTQLRGCS